MIQSILLISMLLVAPQETAQQDETIQLSGVKCIVTGKPVSSRYQVAYKQGKLFFDCNSSRLKFESSKGDFRTKANHQLAVTGQYLQNKCPISKARLSSKSQFTHSVAGFKVRFCCEQCMSTFAEQQDADVRIKAMFGQQSFSSLFLPRPKISKQPVGQQR